MADNAHFCLRNKTAISCFLRRAVQEVCSNISRRVALILLPVLLCFFLIVPAFREQKGKTSYFDEMNKQQEEGKDEDWNKYSAPVTSGKKVTCLTCLARFAHLTSAPTIVPPPLFPLPSTGTICARQHEKAAYCSS